ncbi:MAG: hypothetical protein JO257_14060 [Deltaproteobacteria bacterium]|nr:hypothetical protein [Deltaproteobacteria bacterium]
MRLALLVVLAGCDRLLGLDTVPPAPADAAPPEVGHWSQVAAGEAHTCAIRDDATLWCWGRNDVGQIAAGSAIEVDAPAQVAGSWQTIATTVETTCGIQTDGTLWCWGMNLYKSAGPGTGAMPTKIDGGPYVEVVVGYFHTCALDTGHHVWCWGYDGNGELGDGSAGGLEGVTPRQVATDRTFERIGTGSSHACAITDDDHTLWCWGYGAFGQQGTGDAVSHPSPTQVDDEAWSEVAGGYYHTCGLLSDGRLRCWGYGFKGQTGNPLSPSSYVPQPVGVDSDQWTHVYAISEHTCATQRDGSLWCWGENDNMQLANPATPVVDPVPIMVAPGPASWLTVALGYYHTCGIGDDHALWCTGNESGGRIGDGHGSVLVPEPVMNAPVATQIAAANDQTCVLDANGARWCWGANGRGQLGDGSLVPRDRPTKMRATGTSIVLGDSTGCLLDASMHLQCWGTSSYDEIDDMNKPHYVPYDMQPSIAPWSAIAITTHTCGIGNMGVLYCWGYSEHGEVGAGAGIPGLTYSDPTPIAGGMYTSVAVGDTQTCGTTAGGTYCWGYNYWGELGNGTQSPSYIPSQVDTMTGPVFAAGSVSCQLVGTTLRCWGLNVDGELGVGDVTLRKVPTDLPGTWRQLALGRTHACAIATDGTAWCWGRNRYGELGTGDFHPALSPVQMSTAQWLQLAVGDTHSCGVQTDGSVWCWGNNGIGQLGRDHLRLPYFRLP